MGVTKVSCRSDAACKDSQRLICVMHPRVPAWEEMHFTSDPKSQRRSAKYRIRNRPMPPRSSDRRLQAPKSEMCNRGCQHQHKSTFSLDQNHKDGMCYTQTDIVRAASRQPSEALSLQFETCKPGCEDVSFHSGAEA